MLTSRHLSLYTRYVSSKCGANITFVSPFRYPLKVPSTPSNPSFDRRQLQVRYLKTSPPSRLPDLTLTFSPWPEHLLFLRHRHLQRATGDIRETGGRDHLTLHY